MKCSVVVCCMVLLHTTIYKPYSEILRAAPGPARPRARRGRNWPCAGRGSVFRGQRHLSPTLARFRASWALLRGLGVVSGLPRREWRCWPARSPGCRPSPWRSTWGRFRKRNLKHAKECSIQQRRGFACGVCRWKRRFGCSRNSAVSAARFESGFRERDGQGQHWRGPHSHGGFLKMIVCESGGHANGLTYFIFRFLRRPLDVLPTNYRVFTDKIAKIKCNVL